MATKHFYDARLINILTNVNNVIIRLTTKMCVIKFVENKNIGRNRGKNCDFLSTFHLNNNSNEITIVFNSKQFFIYIYNFINNKILSKQRPLFLK